jgi:hypothetical protein
MVYDSLSLFFAHLTAVYALHGSAKQTIEEGPTQPTHTANQKQWPQQLNGNRLANCQVRAHN